MFHENFYMSLTPFISDSSTREMRMNRISFPSQLRWNTVDTKVVATTCNGVDAEQSFLLVVAILVVDIKQQHN